MPTAQKKSARVGGIAAIHVLKSKLRLDDDTYRAMLAEHGGVTSAASLDAAGRQRVIDHLRRLEREVGPAAARGGAPPPATEAPAAEPRLGWMEIRPDDPPMVRKVCAMWIEIGRAGKVERTTREALNAWVKRQTGIDMVQSLSGRQLGKLIEELKRWLDR